MFSIIRMDTCVLIQSENDFRIFPYNTFHRAKSRKKRNSKIRKAVEVFISDALYIFTRQEWKKGKEKAAEYESVSRLYRWDKTCKSRLSIRSQKARDNRAVNEAKIAAHMMKGKKENE